MFRVCKGLLSSLKTSKNLRKYESPNPILYFYFILFLFVLYMFWEEKLDMGVGGFFLAFGFF